MPVIFIARRFNTDFFDKICLYMNVKLIKIKMKNFEFKTERKEIISQKVPEKVKEIYPIFKDIDKMPKVVYLPEIRIYCLMVRVR